MLSSKVLNISLIIKFDILVKDGHIFVIIHLVTTSYLYSQFRESTIDEILYPEVASTLKFLFIFICISLSSFSCISHTVIPANMKENDK